MIEAEGGEQGVAAVAGAAHEPVAAMQTVVFGVAEDVLDSRSTFQLTFNFFRHVVFLPGDVNGGVRKRHAMPLVSLIDRHALRNASDDFPNVVESRFPCVAVVRITVQRSRLQDEVWIFIWDMLKHRMP